VSGRRLRWRASTGEPPRHRVSGHGRRPGGGGVARLPRSGLRAAVHCRDPRKRRGAGAARGARPSITGARRVPRLLRKGTTSRATASCCSRSHGTRSAPLWMRRRFERRSAGKRERATSAYRGRLGGIRPSVAQRFTGRQPKPCPCGWQGQASPNASLGGSQSLAREREQGQAPPNASLGGSQSLAHAVGKAKRRPTLHWAVAETLRVDGCSAKRQPPGYRGICGRRHGSGDMTRFRDREMESGHVPALARRLPDVDLAVARRLVVAAPT